MSKLHTPVGNIVDKIKTHAYNVVNNQEVVKSAKQSLSIWYGVRGVVTVALIVYTIAIISAHWAATSDEDKKSLEFSNKVLFGQEGTLTIIFYLWVFTFIFVAAYPFLKSLIKAAFLEKSVNAFLK